MKIQIVGAKTIFSCFVTECSLNNYWEALAPSMFLLTYEVSENIERAQVSENIDGASTSQ